VRRLWAWGVGPGALRRAAAVAAALATAACSTAGLRSDKIDYASATPPRSLEVPPDLSQLPRQDRFAVPDRTGAVTASAAAAASRAPSRPDAAVVAPANPKARILREGSQRWLAVDVPPEQAFRVVVETLPTLGLAIEREDPKLGIVETAWAENRAKLPQDIIRRTLGRLLDSVYSTGEQDKFRVRVERTANDASEIFVSHRGMVEVFTSQAQDSTRWQPRPSDPELEAEILQLLAQRFTAQTTAQASAAPVSAAAPAAVVQKELSRLLPADGSSPARVVIDEPFDRAWRRVGLALDRGGFTVEDRDRSQGVYFVRYIDPQFEQQQRASQGFLSKLFGRDVKIEAQQFRVLVAADGARTVVTVRDREGKPEAGPTSGKILAQINDQLR
jgi:outer membrane protein assembly factor BamC